MKKLTSVPNLNILSQKLANPPLNLSLHFLIGIPFCGLLGNMKFTDFVLSHTRTRVVCDVGSAKIPAH